MSPKKVSFYNLYSRCNGFFRSNQNPDEYLASLKGSNVPIRLRDYEFELPDSELLNILHYYISHKFPNHEGIFDETALLALGMIMEYWIDEIIGDNGHGLYIEYAEPGKLKRKYKSNKKRKIIKENEIDTDE